MIILPEITIIAAAFGVLVADLFIAERFRPWLGRITLAALALVFCITALMHAIGSGELFGGQFVVDGVAVWFKLIFILSALVTVALSVDWLDGKTSGKWSVPSASGEYYAILLFNVAGMMFLISARDLVTLYVSLELATLPLFILTAWRRDSFSSEAGLKYVLIGALASALLLYGFGVLYGLTGEMNLGLIAKAIKSSPAFWFGVSMIMAGIGFKLTLVPFHMWAADVYQGAPTPVTAYLSVASKAAGLALMFQIFYQVMGHSLQSWNVPLALAAAITMTVGNLIAMVQNNIKRFMAFSAISQAGYLIMGFLGPSPDGVPAMIFYLAAYTLTNLAAFAVIVFYSNNTGREEIGDYCGLSRTNPIIALCMMIALFGLAGIPPLSGFVGKFFLFSVAAQAGFYWLVAVAAVNSTISLYYYLRIVRQMYIVEPTVKEASPSPLRMTPVIGTILGITVIGSAIVGIIPFVFETIRSDTLNWFEVLVR